MNKYRDEPSNVATTMADDLIDTQVRAGYAFGSVSGSENVAVRNPYIPLYKGKVTV